MTKLAFYIALIFLGLFVLASALHLRASRQRNEENRNRSKIFIIPTLLGFYLFACLDGQMEVNRLFMDFLLLAWAGDCLLTNPTQTCFRVTFFTFAGYSFFLSHVMLIVLFVSAISADAISLPAIVLVCLLASGLALVSVRQLLTYLPHGRRFNCCGYIVANIISAGASLTLLLTCLGTPLWWRALLLFLGNVSFYLSDRLCLSLRMNPRTRLKTHVPDMLTYCVAMLLLTLGVLALPL